MMVESMMECLKHHTREDLMDNIGIVLHLGTLESPCTHYNWIEMEMYN